MIEVVRLNFVCVIFDFKFDGIGALRLRVFVLHLREREKIHVYAEFTCWKVTTVSRIYKKNGMT